MKYLSNRDEFLKRSLNKIEEYKSIEIDLEKLNEADDSGPFANDIPWGNSLIGRLINFGIRKARMGANLLRIKPVGKRLEETFKNLLDGSTTSTLSEENKKDQNRLTISKLLEELDKAVKESANVGEIKRLTNKAIDDISKIEGLENKESLLSQLEEFKKFLEQFKDDEGGKETTDEDEGEGEGEGKGENKEVGVEKGSKTSESVYPTMVKTLKSLALVISNYKQVKIESVKKTTADTSTKETGLKYTTVAGDTIEKIQKNPKANPKELAATDIRTKNTQVLSKYPKDNQTMPAGLVLVMESFMFEAIGEGGSPDRANVKGGEDHLTQAFTKLKKAIETLESPKDKGIGVDVKFLNEITSKSLDTKNKEIIKSLFTEVNRYLVGDKKATLNAATDPLYKESIEIISDKNKKIVVAEKIARFTKRALQFDGEGLYGGLGETGKNLQPFVEGMKSIMAIKPTEEKPAEETTKFKVGDVVKWKNKEGEEISKKIEKVKDGSYYFTSKEGTEYSKKEADLTKESVISKYSSFLSYIKEADEAEASSDKDTQASDPVRMTTSQKIIDYWSKKIDIKSFILERTEEDKIKANFEKITPSKEIVINGLDPIIEIVKLFNRAYKLHTTKVIPNVETSDGRVSASEFANYTPFGDGTRMTAGISGGPYRNNMIFNEWESKVQDIIKKPENEAIFREETVLKTKDGNIIKDAGKNLLKFINDMLDGEELYKPSGRNSDKAMGRQAEFIEKYFGAGSDDLKGGLGLVIAKSDADQNTGNAKDMPTNANLKFKKDLIKMEKLDEMSGSFFACGTKDSEGKTKQIYFYVQSADVTYAYVTYCESFYFFKKYIKQSGQITTSDSFQGLEKQTKTDSSNEDGDYKIKATRIRLVDLINKDGQFILPSKNFNIKYLTKYSSKRNAPSQAPSTGTEEMFIQTCYTLCNIDKENKLTRYKLTKDISDLISTVGGFPKITKTDGINGSLMERK
jgi:hypothetical protein